MSDEAESDGAGTTNEDYRWKGLSTLWSIVYGLGLPAYLIATQVLSAVEILPGTVLSVLLLAWGATVVYVIGPENVEAWKKLTES